MRRDLGVSELYVGDPANADISMHNRGRGVFNLELLFLLTDKALYDRMNGITERIDKLIAAIQTGQGTAGQLVTDKQLYDNMNGAATELRSLIADIRQDPKKFLNVRVSIW